MPRATQLALATVFRGRAIFARATPFALLATLALAACDRAPLPTAAADRQQSDLNLQDVPGTMPGGQTLPVIPLVAGLERQVTHSGKVVLSVDGLGTNQSTGIIQVQKPAGATVLAAYMAAASTGFSGRTLANGDVTIDGVGVTWSITLASTISSSNSWAVVTSLVKTKIDAAPAGLVDFTIGEVSSGGIDGEVLAVVFTDPSLVKDNTIVLLFGAQNTTGDDFNVDLASPVNTSDPTLKIDMSLGISFGFQPGPQVSLVDVNGTRMSSSSGGQDDGDATGNGALLTAGGIGDTNANPAPLAPATDVRTDDELYNLVPFMANGATSILVHSLNPTNDDNIFFAAFNMNVVGNVNCESTPPTVALAGVVAGPPKQIQLTVQDVGSGLQSIEVITSTNATTFVPAFTPATTSPVMVTATKINQAGGSVVGLRVTDVCGNVTLFDPLDVSLGQTTGIQPLLEVSRSFTATGISDVEHLVMIQNGTPGLKSVIVKVNGRKFEISNLRNGEIRRDIDIGSAMVPGENNTVEFRSKGKLGASGIAVLYQ